MVVELFTSQGCSSCPPADAVLAELAKRADVLPLGFHISYWDNLGWKDPFSREASTERQKQYARRLGGGQIYTPQMVVEGIREMIGSRRGEVFAAIDHVRPQAAVAVTFADDRRSVTIGPGRGEGKVFLVRFVRQRATQIAAGENAPARRERQQCRHRSRGARPVEWRGGQIPDRAAGPGRRDRRAGSGRERQLPRRIRALTNSPSVIPAKAGIHLSGARGAEQWIPAFAGMTGSLGGVPVGRRKKAWRTWFSRPPA